MILLFKSDDGKSVYECLTSIFLFHRFLSCATFRKKTTRTIANFDSLVAAVTRKFTPRGFQVVPFYAEDHHIRTTAELFRVANAIVAPHGAGLSHIIFSPEKSVIVEILYGRDERASKNRTCKSNRPWFIDKANLFGQTHFTVVDDGVTCPRYKLPFTAPIEKVIMALDFALGNTTNVPQPV